jgi:hypothetical protein
LSILVGGRSLTTVRTAKSFHSGEPGTEELPVFVADGANQPASAAWGPRFADSPLEESGFEPLVPP